MDLATTTAQVTAFEHEIGFAQAEVNRLEDAELESMERSEALEAQKAVADEAVEDADEDAGARARCGRRRRLRRTRRRWPRWSSSGLRCGRRSARRRSRTTTGLPRSKGTGLAEALNQKCTACQMMLRPQRWNDLRDRGNEDEMMTCESCGRLLYYDPARDAPQRKTVPVESIAASIVRSL